MAVALAPFWLAHGPAREGRAWIERFLQHVPAVDDPPLVASAEGWAIRLEIGHGVGDAVLTQPDLVTRLATAHDVVAASDDDWTALCLADHLATVLRLRGDFDDMERVHAEALARVTSPELDWWRVEILFRQASTFERNDPQRAADLFAEALAVAARVGHEQHVVQLRVDVLRGDIDGARRHAGEIYTRRMDVGDRRRAAIAAGAASALAAAAGDLDDCARWARTCLDLGRSVGYLHGVVWGMMGFTFVALGTGRPDEVARIHGAVTPYLAATRTMARDAFLAVYDRTIAAAEAALGPGLFAEQVAIGARQPWQEAVDAARAAALEPERGRAPSRARGPRANPGLTDREREVLLELARSRTGTRM